MDLLKGRIKSLKNGEIKNKEKEIKLFCGTWNMGNAKAVGLEQFIPEGGGGYDIIVIGLQESSYINKDHHQNTKNKMRLSGSTKSQKVTIDQVIFNIDASVSNIKAIFISFLGPKYYMVDHESRFQMQLFVFALHSLKTSISNVERRCQNTGTLRMPNKVRYYYSLYYYLVYYTQLNRSFLLHTQLDSGVCR